MKKLLSICLAASALALSCTNNEQYVRPAVSEPYDATPERLGRGAYLVNNVAVCHMCHSGRTGKDLTSPVDAEQYLGGMLIEIPGFVRVTAPNLTSSMEGLGGWSDDEVARAIRDGVRKDGSLMGPFMPFYDYRRFSDEDVKSIVVFLRSVKKVDSNKERVALELSFPMNIMMGMMNFHDEPARDVQPIDPSNQVAYGEFLTHVAHCGACHSAMPGKNTGDEEWMSGAPELEEMPGYGFVAAKNLTPHKELGIGKYQPADIKAALRTGHRLDGKPMAPPMSYVSGYYGAMTDQDLDAIAAYLFTLPPAAVEVPERKLTPEGELLVAKGLPVTPVPGAPTVANEAPLEEGEAVPMEEPEAVPATDDAAVPAGEAEPAAAAPASADTAGAN